MEFSYCKLEIFVPMPIPIYEGDTMADVLGRAEEILQRERDRKKAWIARMQE